MSVENPIPDYTDVVTDREYIGICWIPTVCLRFVERDEETYVQPHVSPAKLTIHYLQQMWETAVMNQTGKLVEIHNPGLTQWRDVPVEEI